MKLSVLSSILIVDDRKSKGLRTLRASATTDLSYCINESKEYVCFHPSSITIFFYIVQFMI